MAWFLLKKYTVEISYLKETKGGVDVLRQGVT